MGREIERKFLVETMDWSRLADGVSYRQGYIPTRNRSVVRVRIAGDRATLTVKGPDEGKGRPEYEYPVPLEDATGMLVELCAKPVIEKTRYTIDHGGHRWEVDVFHSDNEGLTVAEVELSRPDEPVQLPSWVRYEVTGDRRYDNSALAERPFRTWEESGAVRD